MSEEVKGIEALLKEAIARGSFDNLPGQGKPLDLNSYFQTPEDLRMGYSVLKSGEFVPEEVQLLKDIEALREELALCGDKERRKELGRRINQKSLNYSLLMERRKKRR